LADVDEDGDLDVVVGVGSGELFALDGRNGTSIWSRLVGSTQAFAPAVAD
jgi:outer membrane protein assembly factor BamB